MKVIDGSLNISKLRKTLASALSVLFLFSAFAGVLVLALPLAEANATGVNNTLPAANYLYPSTYQFPTWAGGGVGIGGSMGLPSSDAQVQQQLIAADLGIPMWSGSNNWGASANTTTHTIGTSACGGCTLYSAPQSTLETKYGLQFMVQVPLNGYLWSASDTWAQYAVAKYPTLQDYNLTNGAVIDNTKYPAVRVDDINLAKQYYSDLVNIYNNLKTTNAGLPPLWYGLYETGGTASDYGDYPKPGAQTVGTGTRLDMMGANSSIYNFAQSPQCGASGNSTVDSVTSLAYGSCPELAKMSKGLAGTHPNGHPCCKTATITSVLNSEHRGSGHTAQYPTWTNYEYFLSLSYAAYNFTQHEGITHFFPIDTSWPTGWYSGSASSFPYPYNTTYIKGLDLLNRFLVSADIGYENGNAPTPTSISYDESHCTTTPNTGMMGDFLTAAYEGTIPASRTTQYAKNDMYFMPYCLGHNDISAMVATFSSSGAYWPTLQTYGKILSRMQDVGYTIYPNVTPTRTDSTTLLRLVGTSQTPLLAWLFTNKSSTETASVSLTANTYHINPTGWIAISMLNMSVIEQCSGSCSTISLSGIRIPSRSWNPIYIMNYTSPANFASVYTSIPISSATTTATSATYKFSGAHDFPTTLITRMNSAPTLVTSNNTGAFRSMASLTLFNTTAVGMTYSGTWTNNTQGIYFYDSTNHLLYSKFLNGNHLSITVTTNTLATTTTSVTCVPNPVSVQVNTVCTAIVTDTSGSPTTPTSSVRFSSTGYLAVFDHDCILSGSGATATCALTANPPLGSQGTYTTNATYTGDATHNISFGTTSLTISPSSTITTTTHNICMSLDKCILYGNNYWWMFYLDSSGNSVYSSSSDGITWANDKAYGFPSASNVRDFYVNSTTLFVAATGTTSNTNVYYRTWPLGAGTLGASSSSATINFGSYNGQFFISISVDSGGHPWIGTTAYHNTGRGGAAFYLAYYLSGGTWRKSLNTTAEGGQLVALSSGRMAVIGTSDFIGNAASIKIQYVNGTGGTWSSAYTLGSSSSRWSRFSVTAIKNKVWLAYGSLATTNGYIYVASFLYGATSWSARTTIDSSGTALVAGISADSSQNLIVYYAVTPSTLDYKTSVNNGSSWSGVTTTSTTETVSSNSYGYYVVSLRTFTAAGISAFVWMSGSNIRFYQIQVGPMTQQITFTVSPVGSPTATFSVSTNCNTNSTTVAGDGSPHWILSLPSCTTTITVPTRPSTTEEYNFTGGATTFTVTTPAGPPTTPASATYYYVSKNTLNANPETPTTFSANIHFVLTGLMGGMNTACTITVPGSPSASTPYGNACWFDTSAVVQFPGSTNNPSNAQWFPAGTIYNSPSFTALVVTSGHGLTYTVQYIEALTNTCQATPQTPALWDTSKYVKCVSTLTGVSNVAVGTMRIASGSGANSTGIVSDYSATVTLNSTIVVTTGHHHWVGSHPSISFTTGGNLFNVNYKRQWNITVAASPAASGSTTPTGWAWYNDTTTVNIAATPSGLNVFSLWTTTNSSITFGNSALATTTFLADGYGTVTATFAGITSSTVELKLTLAQAGLGAPTTTFTISGCSPSPSTVLGDGNVHAVTMTNLCSYVVTITNAGGSRYGFIIIAGVFSNTSPVQNSCASGTCPETDLLYYLQEQLAVVGGNGVTYSRASETNDGWYYYADTLTVSSNGVYSRAAGTGTRIASWNIDGGTNTNVATVAPVTTSTVTMSATHTVNFNSATQYDLTLSTGTGGTVAALTMPTISGDTGWYDATTVVQIKATPNGGYAFSAWVGSGTISFTGATTNPCTVTMNSPIAETASFYVIGVAVLVNYTGYLPPYPGAFYGFPQFNYSFNGVWYVISLSLVPQAISADNNTYWHVVSPQLLDGTFWSANATTGFIQNLGPTVHVTIDFSPGGAYGGNNPANNLQQGQFGASFFNLFGALIGFGLTWVSIDALIFLAILIRSDNMLLSIGIFDIGLIFVAAAFPPQIIEFALVGLIVSVVGVLYKAYSNKPQ